MKVLTLVPAYGRDYSSEEKAVKSWQDGKDWQIRCVSSPFSGSYCSIRDSEQLVLDGYTHVNLRYSGLTQIIPVEI